MFKAPSPARLRIAIFAPPPPLWVVLQQDANTVTLLGPEQFYAFDGAGRVCHEFVRYIAQPNGTILAQEIVKRVFDPADGGRELVIRETIGGTDASERVPARDGSVPSTENSIASELRTSTESLDTGTIEGQWTPWAFGLSFDRAGGTDASERVLARDGSVPSAPWISVGLESYDVLWEVGDADSGRLVLQGEKDGETARLVLDEMGSTMTKELTDSRTGLRFHQGSILAASEMQWFPADATQGDTVVRVDEWFGLGTDGASSKPKNSRKAVAAAPLGIPRAAIRTSTVGTAQLAAGPAGYLADLFDMALGLNDAVYALPTADDTITTVILEDTGEDDSLTAEESEDASALADDLLYGLLPATAGGCGPTYILERVDVIRENPGDVTASGNHEPASWSGDQITFSYPSPPTSVVLTAVDTTDYAFDHWRHDGIPSDYRYLTLETTETQETVSVYFVAKNPELTVTRFGDGDVSATGGGEASAWVNDVKTFEYSSYPGIVTLSPAPGEGYAFDHWVFNGVSSTGNPPGNTLSVKMDKDQEVEVHFVERVCLYALALPPDEGTVQVTGDGVSSALAPEYIVDYGTVLTVTAQPAPGSQFSYWAGDVGGSTNPISITMDRDKTAAAVFVPSTAWTPGQDVEEGQGIETHWYKSEGWAVDGYWGDRFAHRCLGADSVWASMEIYEVTRHAGDSVGLTQVEKDQINAADGGGTPKWKTKQAFGATLGVPGPGAALYGYWMVKIDNESYCGDAHLLELKPTMASYFQQNPGIQTAVIVMNQEFRSVANGALLEKNTLIHRYIEIPIPDPAGYSGKLAHQIIDKNGKHIPANTPISPYNVIGWPPSQPRPITMPYLVSFTEAIAENRIGIAGLVRGATTYANHPTIPSGSVCGQSPNSGIKVWPGSSVDLTISSGP